MNGVPLHGFDSVDLWVYVCWIRPHLQKPKLTVHFYFLWKKYVVLSKHATIWVVAMEILVISSWFVWW